jgi:hypothetical protein
MARRYSRDNRGRFASGGTGATARGGRLKTASGKTRATQTTKAAAAKPSGTVAGKVKRNPAAAGKIGKAKAATPKTTQAVAKPRASKLGSRIDPAKQANRKATAAVDRAMATERKSMNAAMRTKGEFSSPARQAANKRVEDAQRETASLIQTRRNIRAQFPVATANKPIRAARPKSTISSKTVGASAKNARVSRAKANLAAAENRRNYTGKNLARSKRTARKALEFMSNPRSAIQNRSLGLGFRMPKTGRPKSTAKAAAKPAAPKAARPRRQVTETQLGNAAKRAKKVEISRYLSESDRMNAGGKETFAKRSAASQLRAEKGRRTSQAAKAFLSNYGTPSLFGQRPVSSTKDSPRFGSKKRKRR